MSVRLFKVFETYTDDMVYLATVNLFLEPLQTYKAYVTHFGMTYRGVIKNISHGHSEVVIPEENVICDVTEKLKREFAASRIARYWRAHCVRRRERALATLRPALMHWAFRPDGPLGRKVIAALETQ